MYLCAQICKMREFVHMPKKRKYNIIDLFAGAGGLSEGFVRAGFNPIAHIEMDHYACDTLRTRACYHYLAETNQLDIYKEYLRNKKERENGEWLWNQVPDNIVNTVIQATIGEDTIKDIFAKVDALKKKKRIDVIVGGPPCQAYSIAGRARLGEKKIEQDPRNELYKYYVKFIANYRPKMFVFENVLGILTAKGGKPFADLQRLVRELGYEIEYHVQLASEHGVLQNRQRVIIIGWQSNNRRHYHYPILTKEANSYQVLQDAFSDLPVRRAGEGSLCGIVDYTKPLSEMKYLQEANIRGALNFTTQHIARPNNINDREIYVMALKKFLNTHKQLSYNEIPEDHQKHKNKKSFLNRFSVVDPYGCSHTVVAHIAMDGHYYIYPTLHPTIENVRSITIREAARLQSFPDDYFFEGSRSAAFKQIGNAVPVLLAYKIAVEIKRMLP